jgi:hypothetical protein
MVFAFMCDMLFATGTRVWHQYLDTLLLLGPERYGAGHVEVTLTVGAPPDS